MSSKLKLRQNYFSDKPYKLFLLDGLGAIVSAFMLGVVLMSIHDKIGMPKEKLFYLAIAPCFFAAYSLFCFWRKPKNWRSLLKIISISNLFYCLITFALLFVDKASLTFLGYLYFIVEILIVIPLAIFEFKVAQS